MNKSLLYPQLTFYGLKLGRRLGIVFMPADIHPVTRKRVIIHWLAVLKKNFYQVREIQVAMASYVTQDLGFKNVNPHAHEVGGGGFFHIVLDAAMIVRDNHPQVNGHLALIGPNGGDGTVFLVAVQELSLIHIS